MEFYWKFIHILWTKASVREIEWGLLNCSLIAGNIINGRLESFLSAFHKFLIDSELDEGRCCMFNSHCRVSYFFRSDLKYSVQNVVVFICNSFVSQREQRFYLQPCHESDGNSNCIRVHRKGKRNSLPPPQALLEQLSVLIHLEATFSALECWPKKPLRQLL